MRQGLNPCRRLDCFPRTSHVERKILGDSKREKLGGSTCGSDGAGNALGGTTSAVERESGIGGRMVRTKKRTATEECNSAPGADENQTGLTYLGNKAVSGDQSSLDNLMKLSNEGSRGEPSETNQHGFSQAIAWRSESEWQGESSEAEGETAGGSREPEGNAD
jgi:hypothetical protein